MAQKEGFLTELLCGNKSVNNRKKRRKSESDERFPTKRVPSPPLSSLYCDANDNEDTAGIDDENEYVSLNNESQTSGSKQYKSRSSNDIENRKKDNENRLKEEEEKPKIQKAERPDEISEINEESSQSSDEEYCLDIGDIKEQRNHESYLITNNILFGYQNEDSDEETLVKNSLIERAPLTMLKKFKPRYANKRSEASRGVIHGSHEVSSYAPGIPTKKFAKSDLNQYGSSDKEWDVQAVYDSEIEGVKIVVYEGWTANTSSLRDAKILMRTAPRMMEICELRGQIINAIACHGKEVCSKVTNYRHKPKAIFWCYEDLSYFHTKENEKRDWAPVFYMISKTLNPQTAKNNFPKMTFVTENIITEKSLKKIEQNETAVHIKEAIRNAATSGALVPVSVTDIVTNCSSTYCKCNIRAQLLYSNSNAVRLTYTDTGLLDLKNYRSGSRFIIECSDSCKCDDNCLNRRSQKGQQIPLVVIYEDHNKRFGVRAGRNIRTGEFICEYLGLLCADEETKNEVYLLEVAIIASGVCVDSFDFGGVGRYINHSCDPNSMFVEVHSRVKEHDHLIPKIGIYSMKDIQIGEEITVAYYDEEQLSLVANSRRKRIRCHCNTDKCQGWLPCAE